MSSQVPVLKLAEKVRLAFRIWRSYVRARVGLARRPLPVFAREFGSRSTRPTHYPPELLSRAVDRCLRVGGFRTRCLTSALVLYQLLREQGDDAELVIGLPAAARDHAAHAWVELAGRDIGPPPGRGHHAELARFSPTIVEGRHGE